uniref:Uncharacterized protein n=1 Tax=Cacopsylla melanoneura TaxID=428564 RepID=A0A8D8SPX0_9HEMI
MSGNSGRGEFGKCHDTKLLAMGSFQSGGGFDYSCYLPDTVHYFSRTCRSQLPFSSHCHDLSLLFYGSLVPICRGLLHQELDLSYLCNVSSVLAVFPLLVGFARITEMVASKR